MRGQGYNYYLIELTGREGTEEAGPKALAPPSPNYSPCRKVLHGDPLPHIARASPSSSQVATHAGRKGCICAHASHPEAAHLGGREGGVDFQSESQRERILPGETAMPACGFCSCSLLSAQGAGAQALCVSSSAPSLLLT